MRIIPRLVLVSFLVLVFVLDARADTYPRQAGVDALHYVFRLTLLTGDTNNIAGEASVTVRFTSAGIRQVSLDLTSAANGKGMSVSSVTLAAAPIRFAHEGNRLTMTLPAPSIAGDEASFTITYGGIPSEGLRLIDNMHGERTAFSENWPDRARQWLPMIDHPYDKATGEFIVTTAAGFQVIANGLLQEELDLPHGLRRTHWKQSVPISSWLYALGVARFAAHHYGHAKGVPLQVWVFPQDREKGYRLFESTGRRALEFFAEQIGPYSYEKLGHVQAAGLSGGTEHASVIFYGEKGVAAGRAPVVHEVAHQWWGNAVTERDWDDVWLSEGFATYFTLLYTEQFEGRDAFVAGLTRSPAHAARCHRHRGLLDRHTRVLPPIPRPERDHRRAAPRDGSRVRQGSAAPLHSVADPQRSAQAHRNLAIRRLGKAGPRRTRAGAVWRAIHYRARDRHAVPGLQRHAARAHRADRTAHARDVHSGFRTVDCRARPQHVGAHGAAGLRQKAVIEYLD
ncbi:MAG: hypothetical protein LC753_15370 [Acidobacteria bacterium]|nr:hypothetical protein [Acidobacteriota bacterium]